MSFSHKKVLSHTKKDGKNCYVKITQKLNNGINTLSSTKLVLSATTIRAYFFKDFINQLREKKEN